MKGFVLVLMKAIFPKLFSNRPTDTLQKLVNFPISTSKNDEWICATHTDPLTQHYDCFRLLYYGMYKSSLTNTTTGVRADALTYVRVWTSNTRSQRPIRGAEFSSSVESFTQKMRGNRFKERITFPFQVNILHMFIQADINDLCCEYERLVK